MTSTPHDSLTGLTAAAADRQARILLSASIEPGDTAVGRIVRTQGAVEMLRLLFSDDSAAPGLDAESLSHLRAHAVPALTTTHITDVLQVIHDTYVTALTPDDDAWPSRLSDLGDAAPLALFARGNPALLTAPSVTATVGARAATGYGTHVAAELATDLTARGHVILAGGAYGIDAAAHRAALTVGGKTIAMLAGGVDRPYPSGNTQLFEQIVQAGGLLVSETAPTLPPTRWRFLRRSRLIAALAHRVLIVEAGFRSGTRHIATQATELRRPIGVVPGPITSAASAGCHAELRGGGAVPVTSADDVHALQPAPSVSGSGDFPSLDSLDVLTADWDDDPALTAEHRRILRALPVREVQEILTGNARSVEAEFLALLDGVRSATTRQLLYRHGIDLDA